MGGLKVLILALVFFNLISIIYAAQNDTMVVEVNVLAPEIPSNTVSIEVPDYLFMDNISVGESTDKFRVEVNNSGNVDIIITPLLQDPDDEIFSNLWFQNRKTGNNSQEYAIGEYSFNITASSTPGGKNDEYFWMWLDLTNFEGNIEEDMIGRRADLLFIALPNLNGN
jgi:hypothetical protein